MGEFLKAAQILKARKRQGRLVVRPCDGLPFVIHDGMTAHIVPPSLDLPRQVVVCEVKETEAEYTLAFEGVSDYNALLEYVGRYLLISRDDIDADEWEDAEPDLTGFRVEDARLGALGVVVGMNVNAFQATLVVEGAHGEVLIPFVDAFVEAIDDEECVISTRVPDGLVEE